MPSQPATVQQVGQQYRNHRFREGEPVSKGFRVLGLWELVGNVTPASLFTSGNHAL